MRNSFWKLGMGMSLQNTSESHSVRWRCRSCRVCGVSVQLLGRGAVCSAVAISSLRAGEASLGVPFGMTAHMHSAVSEEWVASVTLPRNIFIASK